MKEFDLQDIFGVAVIYNASLESCTTLSTLNKSAAALNKIFDIIIYDNSPQAQNTSPLVEFTFLNCNYYQDSSNPGVSKAYNYAANQIGNSRKFILLLDQDTAFPVDSLEKYIEGVNTFPGQKIFCPILQTSRGIYSPTKYYFRRGMIWKDVTPGVHSLKNRNILNSGLLVDLETYRSIGGYNEKIELYFSDFDFVNRFREKHNELVVLNLVCGHSLSDIDNTDTNSALRRFRHYVTGSYYSIASTKDYIYLFVTIMLRAFKLSFQFRNSKFLGIFFKKYLIEKIF